MSSILLYVAATRSPFWCLPISVVVFPRVFFHEISIQYFFDILVILLPAHCNLLNVIYFTICAPSNNSLVKVRVKFALEQATKSQRGSRGIALLFLYLGARWGGWSTPGPAALPPGKRRGTHRTGGWVGPRAGLDGRRRSRPSPGFDHLIVQPVASRCTDWANPAINNS